MLICLKLQIGYDTAKIGTNCNDNEIFYRPFYKKRSEG